MCPWIHVHSEMRKVGGEEEGVTMGGGKEGEKKQGKRGERTGGEEE